MLEQLSLEAIGAGATGSLLFEATRWGALRTRDRLPRYAWKLHYWILSAVLISVGGITAAVFTPGSLQATVAIGISAPAIVTQIARTFPQLFRRLTLGAQENASLEEWIQG
jgi:hypothetical protein